MATVVAKSVLMGLFGLTSSEANRIPHGVRPRRDGGHMCVYAQAAENAWEIVGGVGEWEARLARLSVQQASRNLYFCAATNICSLLQFAMISYKFI